MRMKICMFFVGLKICQNTFSSYKKMVVWGLLMYALHFIVVWLQRGQDIESCCMEQSPHRPRLLIICMWIVKGRRWRWRHSGFRLICYFLEPAWYDIHNSHDRGCKSVAIKSRLAPRNTATSDDQKRKWSHKCIYWPPWAGGNLYTLVACTSWRRFRRFSAEEGGRLWFKPSCQLFGFPIHPNKVGGFSRTVLNKRPDDGIFDMLRIFLGGTSFIYKGVSNKQTYKLVSLCNYWSLRFSSL